MNERPSLSIGIEEEYQIVDPRTRELHPSITEFIEAEELLNRGQASKPELKPELHQSMVRYAHVHPRAPDSGPMREVLGFPLPGPLVQELEALDLLTHPTPSRTQVLLVETNPNLSQTALSKHLGGAANFQHESFDNLRDLRVDVLLQDELNHPSLAWINPRLRLAN